MTIKLVCILMSLCINDDKGLSTEGEEKKYFVEQHKAKNSFTNV